MGIGKICFIICILLCLSINVIASSVTFIKPNGQGRYADWKEMSCVVGQPSDKWKCVDENSPQGDLLISMTKDSRVSFVFQDINLKDDETINSVTLYYYAKSNMGGAIRALFKDDKGKHLGIIKHMFKNFKLESETYTTNPSTGKPWTKEEVNNFEAGFEQYHGNGWGPVGTVMLDQVYASIDYSIPDRSDACSDTDGNDNSTSGTVSGYFNELFYSEDDYCVDSSNVMEYTCNGNQKESQEYNCGTDGYVGNNFCYESNFKDGKASTGDVYKDYIDYSCSNGKCSAQTIKTLQDDCSSNEYCHLGECIKLDSCTDSDNGNLFKQGTVSGFFDNTPYSQTDYCVSANTIMEYSCDRVLMRNQSQLCGLSGYTSELYCQDNNVVRDYTLYSCYSGECYTTNSTVVFQYCFTGQTCINGECKTN